MKNYRNLLLIVLAFVAGGIGTLATTIALAHGGDTNLIHACVRNTSIGNLSNIRIIGANDTCNSNETALDWPKTAGNSDFSCIKCTSRDLLLRLNQPDLIGVNFNRANLSEAFLINEDFTGSSFIEAVLAGFSANAGNLTDTNFTNANLRLVDLGGANLTRANLTGADLFNADLTGANMTDANVTNIMWDQTRCPDGTISDDNGKTCEGHLTP